MPPLLSSGPAPAGDAPSAGSGRDRPLRVALAIHRLFAHGGLQRDALATAAECARRGHRVLLLTQRLEGAAAPGAEVRVLRTPGLTNHGRAARFGRRAAAAARAWDADVLLGFEKLPGLDAYFVGDPCYTRRARARRGPLARVLPRDRAFGALERAVFGPGGARRILLLHPGQDAPFREEYGTAAERFVTLPPGVGRDRRRGPDAGERRARLRAELGAGPDDVVLLQLGSDFVRKGVDRSARAVAALARAGPGRAMLAVAGDDDPGRIRAALAPLGERARLLGPRDDAPDLLQGADLLIHPARSEPGGAVLLEALVAGTPVIASGCCGYAARVREAGAGRVLAEPFDQAALDAAVRELAGPGGAPLRAELSGRALAYARDHDELHGMHGAIVDALEELVP